MWIIALIKKNDNSNKNQNRNDNNQMVIMMIMIKMMIMMMIMIMFGTDLAWTFMMENGIRRGPPNLPMAMGGKWGFSIIRPMCHKEKRASMSNALVTSDCSFVENRDQLEQSFSDAGSEDQSKLKPETEDKEIQVNSAVICTEKKEADDHDHIHRIAGKTRPNTRRKMRLARV